MNQISSLNRRIRIALAGLAALLACAPLQAGPAVPVAHRAAAMSSKRTRAMTPQAAMRGWKALPRATANAMMAKYGPPDQFDRRSLAWFQRGPWKRTIVRRSGSRFLEQAVGYEVPADKIADVVRFSPHMEYSQTAGELIFRSDSEKLDYLALNLAHNIIAGQMTVAEARASFARASKLAASGKSIPAMRGLQFEVDNRRMMTPTGADR